MHNTQSAMALIGCGKMGSAMLKGWQSQKSADRYYILDPADLPPEINTDDVIHCKTQETFREHAKTAKTFVVAVKPQILKEVCAGIKDIVSPDALIISIAAGTNIKTFEDIFGAEQPILRAMPNTPAAIGKGITVLATNNHVTEPQKQQAEKLLKAVGETEWLEDESMMDAVTAVSGSGPAYVFLFIELLAKAGVKAGLDEKLAMNLARQTVIGSADLANIEKEISVETLRKNVTSRGGTTEAALSVLTEDNSLGSLLTRAVVKATAKSKELGNN